MTWAIKARRMSNGSRSAVVQDAIVVIDDGRISAAGPASQVSVPPGAEVMDVRDRTAMPGLIDAHVHILLSGSLSSGAEDRAATESQALLQGVRNAQLALTKGLTTVRDCGGRNYLSLTLRDFISRGGIAGPRLICSGPVITTTAGHLWWSGSSVTPWMNCGAPREPW